MIKLNVQFSDNIKPIGKDEVGGVIGALDKVLKPDEITIGIRITPASAVQEINKKYAGKDEPTDVLSFNYAEGPKSPVDEKAGDVVVSYDHVVEQAKQAGTSPETELALLILHGILHVLGRDHQNAKQQAELDKLQGEIMTNAGLVYRDFNWQT